METKDLPQGERYWEYVLIHVDDLLVASRRAKEIMESISQVYKLKEDKVTKKCYGPPEMYLGTKIHKWRDKDADPDDPYCWSMSGDHYVKNIVNNVEEQLKSHGRQLNANQKSPFMSGYRPEMDISPELNDKQVNLYQEMIGCLR